MSRTVQVIGGGLAGCSAAIAARQCGAGVVLYEKSAFPRHKVCGEFLSPEAEPLLRRAGVWEELEALEPARVRRLRLCFRRRTTESVLPQPAFGLSRFALDACLWRQAAALGVETRREVCRKAPSGAVIAYGRETGRAEKGERLFGFKAHFTGLQNDAVELYFFRGCYVGVNAVEAGRTNVCGLGPESVLRETGFGIQPLLESFAPLQRRLQTLRPAMDWLHVGPLLFRAGYQENAEEQVYRAGDALSFVDPFTGSGMLSALISGTIAGRAAAQTMAIPVYQQECRQALGRAFWFSSQLRALLGTAWAERLAGLVPGSWLYRATRPRLRADHLLAAESPA